MLLRAVLVSACLFFLGKGDTYKPATVRFEPTLDAAFARAKKEKIPVMVCVVMDNESANDTVAWTYYRDPELGELSKHAACVIASIGTHADYDEVRGDSTRRVCGRFGSITCAEHQAIEMEARKRWLPGDSTVAPQHLFFDPSGKEIARHAYLIDLGKLKKMLQMARYVVDPTSVDRALIEKELQEARDVYKNAMSKNQATRKPALDALAAYEDPRAFKLLTDLAESKTDDLIRTEAIRAMSQKGSYRALPILTNLLKEPKVLIRNNAVVGLERLKLPEAAPALLKLYKSEQSDRVQGSILRALGKCAPKNPDAIALIVKESASKSYLTRLDDAVALGFLPDSPKVLEILRTMAEKDDNSNLRGVGVWALGLHRDKDAIEILNRVIASDMVLEVKTVATAALKAIQDGTSEEYEDGFQTFVRDEVGRE
ncbi:MAG: HEAT repeat domain-containing protein [Planctomycetes bacterium]|nr:HEAT repeat domain-containing protein [Planctomycetota bacterium]